MSRATEFTQSILGYWAFLCVKLVHWLQWEMCVRRSVFYTTSYSHLTVDLITVVLRAPYLYLKKKRFSWSANC